MKSFRNYMILGLALTAMAFSGCGDDDPVAPEPQPSPTPQPTTVLNGYGCMIKVHDILGNKDGFNKMLKDSINRFCPELKETSNGTYIASIVFEENDTTRYNKLKNNFRAFEAWFYNYCRTAKSPVVSISSTTTIGTERKATKEWVFTGNNASNLRESELAISIPTFNSSIFTTDDPKSSGINEISFGKRWSATGKKELMFSNSALVNGKDEYNGARQGEAILLLDKENQVRYGFTISSDGESINLVMVGKDKLPKEEIVTYKVN